MRISLLFTTISILSIGNGYASDKLSCDKVGAMKNIPTQALNLRTEISGSEMYQSDKDEYRRVIVKTTDGKITSSDYKKYLARCQKESFDTVSR